MADANEQNQPTTSETNAAGDLISRAEAKKAFEARDKAKKELQALMDSGRLLSDDDLAQFQALRENAAKAEEERKRKAGEFDNWRTQITEKHTKELQERESKLTAMSDRFKQTVIKAEFGAAIDFFGGDTAKTILDVELGMAALGRFVSVEDVDDDAIGYRVIVKDPKGQTILGKDGNPAPFTEAIGELIQQLPNRDRILRGSGKTGSGSSGGSTGSSQPVDLRNLTPARLKDPKVVEALKAIRSSGGITMGSAFQS
jgi:hypothetical protein